MLLTTKQVCQNYNVTRLTLLQWEKEGFIHPLKTPKGTRRYLKSDIEHALGLKEHTEPYTTILYARVSTKKQEKYLQNQIDRLKEYAVSIGDSYEVISEIASGVNEKRRGLKKLLNQIKNGNVKKVIIEYPDRLARFGYDYLKVFFDSFGVELIVLHAEDDGEDMQKELAEDLIAVVSSFAARIYGRRGGHTKSKS